MSERPDHLMIRFAELPDPGLETAHTGPLRITHPLTPWDGAARVRAVTGTGALWATLTVAEAREAAGVLAALAWEAEHRDDEAVEALTAVIADARAFNGYRGTGHSWLDKAVARAVIAAGWKKAER